TAEQITAGKDGGDGFLLDGSGDFVPFVADGIEQLRRQFQFGKTHENTWFQYGAATPSVGARLRPRKLARDREWALRTGRAKCQSLVEAPRGKRIEKQPKEMPEIPAAIRQS